MNDSPNFLQNLLLTLSKANVDFVICGGVAVVLHGVERVTMDVDIALNFDTHNTQRFVNCIKTIGLQPRVAIPIEDFLNEEHRNQWRKEKGAIVFTFVDQKYPSNQIDVFLEPPIQFETLKSSALQISIKDIYVYIASIDDLIYMKSLTGGRKHDIDDIEALKKIKASQRHQS